MKIKVFDFFLFKCVREQTSVESLNMSYQIFNIILTMCLICHLVWKDTRWSIHFSVIFFGSMHLHVDLCALKSLIFWSRHTYTLKLTLGKLSFIQFNALNVQVKIHIGKGVENVGVSSCLKYKKCWKLPGPEESFKTFYCKYINVSLLRN